MEVRKIEKAIFEIVEKKKQLSKINYNDEAYDAIEDALHELEDEFIDTYGLYLEDALVEAHKKCGADNEILFPIAYIADHYIKVGEEQDGSNRYDVDSNQGVYVELDRLPEVVAKLVIVPGPLRIILIASSIKEEVWAANKKIPNIYK